MPADKIEIKQILEYFVIRRGHVRERSALENKKENKKIMRIIDKLIIHKILIRIRINQRNA